METLVDLEPVSTVPVSALVDEPASQGGQGQAVSRTREGVLLTWLLWEGWT